jgi:hypothetical protein
MSASSRFPRLFAARPSASAAVANSSFLVPDASGVTIYKIRLLTDPLAAAGRAHRTS